MIEERQREPRYNIALDASFRNGAGTQRPVRVTNLSATGCRFVSLARPLAMGTFIALGFGPAGVIDAKVRWRVGGTHGVRFERALHPAVVDHIRLFLSEEPALVAEREPMMA